MDGILKSSGKLIQLIVSRAVIEIHYRRHDESVPLHQKNGLHMGGQTDSNVMTAMISSSAENDLISYFGGEKYDKG